MKKSRREICLLLAQVIMGAATCPSWHQGRAGTSTKQHRHLVLQLTTLETGCKETAQEKPWVWKAHRKMGLCFNLSFFAIDRI